MFAVHLEIITEIGKIMITPFWGAKHDRSLLLWSVSDFWGHMWLYFFTVQFGSQSRGIYKPANQKAEKVLARKRPYDTKSHRVCRFQKFPHDEISWFDIQADAWIIDLVKKKENHRSDEFKVESNECAFWWCRSLNRMQRLRWIQGIL